MSTFKTIVLSLMVIAVNARTVYNFQPFNHFFDSNNIIEDDVENVLSEHSSESWQPRYLITPRVRRQVHGSMRANTDGSSNLNFKLPLAGNEHNALSAIGSIGSDKNGGLGSAGGGLAFENINGHGASLTGRHIPSFGDQLTTAAKVNLFQNDNHKLDANAFLTKTMPSNPDIPSFNTHGGSLDYTFKDKIGGSLGISQTPMFERTDYSAMGNLNLFRGRDSSLDLSGGFTKSVSPYIPNDSWQPSAGLTFTKYW